MIVLLFLCIRMKVLRHPDTGNNATRTVRGTVATAMQVRTLAVLTITRIKIMQGFDISNPCSEFPYQHKNILTLTS